MRRCLAAALTVLGVAAASASGASITQTGCFEAPGFDRGCAETIGLGGAASAAVSPDGRHVYVGGNVEEKGVLLTFARDTATGALTPQACAADDARDGCTPSEGLFGVNDVAISRNGLTVYALGILPGTLGVFRRDPATGALTEIQCWQTSFSATCGRAAMENPWKFVLTADGRSLLVEGSHITSFAVTDDGTLADPVTERVRGVRNPAGIAVGASPTRVFAVGGTDDRGKVSVLDRDTGTGRLTTRACAGSGSSLTPDCRRVVGVDGPADLAVSPDGRGLYLAASAFRSSNADPFSFHGVQLSSAISVFSPSSAAQKDCLLFTGLEREREGCRRGPKSRGPGFSGARTLAFTPNGRILVAGFDKSSAVLLLARNPRTQALTALSGRRACVRDPGRRARLPRRCSVGKGIHQPNDIAISPDGRNAYVTTTGGLVVFRLAP